MKSQFRAPFRPTRGVLGARLRRESAKIYHSLRLLGTHERRRGSRLISVAELVTDGLIRTLCRAERRLVRPVVRGGRDLRGGGDRHHIAR
jgi:hypothetical protein